jgi:precorrin-6Y C5,15-methyltransferase (decarboxylating)
MDKIRVVGLGQNFEDIFPSYKDIIFSADVLIGGKRQIELFEQVICEKIVIFSPIEKLINKIKKFKDKNIVILSDGDPLFFGIGERLIKEFGKDRVEIFPNVSILQRAASKIGVSPKKIHVISLHGREDIFPFLNAISWYEYVGIYTDKINTPDRIARILLEREIFDFKLYVFEDLGSKQERIRFLSIKEASNSYFSELNFVILKRIRPREFTPYIGMEDEIFFKDKNQITKKEIRVLSLSQMRIEQDSCILDIGAGSGSISIESLVLAKKGRVFAIEKNPKRAEIIRKNRSKFGTYALEVIEGKAEDVILNLPQADRIFIGGGLSSNMQLLEMVYKKLISGGRIVINTVLIETLSRCINFCKSNSLSYEIIQLHIDRGELIGNSLRMVPINPVMIVTIKG